MALIHGANTLAASGYTVANSCRFNDGDNAYMHKTPGSAGNQDVWTFSTWFKRSGLTKENALFVAGSNGSNATLIWFRNDDVLEFSIHNGGTRNGRVQTEQKFRDVSAWYHLVVSYNSADGTAADRMKIYINGVRVTATINLTNPSSGQDSLVNHTSKHSVGSDGAIGFITGAGDFDGYMAETVLLDGTAATPTSFGEFDEDSPTIWKPKDVSELTFGTNGFYLDYEDSANLGNDANGGTDLTENNIAAADQAFDTPTNNFATMNPLDNFFQGYTYSEGNCKVVTQANNVYTFASSTLAVSSGKWYAECKLAASGGYADIGIADTVSSGTVDSLGGDANEYAKHDFSANVTAQGSGVSNGSALSVGNICGVFLDLDNSKLYFSINGSLQNTTGIGITAAASTTNGYYLFGGGDEDGGSAVTLEWNFGGCSSFSLSSAVTDDNGYGNFEYTPTVTVESTETKFYAVCTKNLAEYG